MLVHNEQLISYKNDPFLESNKTKLEVDVNEQQAQPKAQLSHRSNLTKQEKPYADETVLKPVENLLRQVTPEPVVEPKKEVIIVFQLVALDIRYETLLNILKVSEVWFCKLQT